MTLALAVGLPVEAQSSNSPSAESRLVDAVCDKRVVALGELPTHGEALGFQLKARIVRRLVEKCGFGALVLRRRSTISSAFRGPWHNGEPRLRSSTTP